MVARSLLLVGLLVIAGAAWSPAPLRAQAPSATDSAVVAELRTAEAELSALRYRYTDDAKPVRDLTRRVSLLRQEAASFAGPACRELREAERDVLSLRTRREPADSTLRAAEARVGRAYLMLRDIGTQEAIDCLGLRSGA